MPSAAAKASLPLCVVWGDEEFTVKKRARQLYDQWCQDIGGMDHEIIQAAAANAGEALRALGRLQESLQTLPFFGSGKVVWFQNCNFLGEDRVSAAQSVTERLADLVQEWKALPWDNVRLLISAGKIDKRRSFYRALEKLASVENYAEWSPESRDWSEKAEVWARQELATFGKAISDEGLGELVAQVGPHVRQLHNEVEKLSLYVGERPTVESDDVAAIVTRQKQARAFALGDALGDRDLPRLLRALDEELWEMKSDTQKSAIGILYGLISKVRVLLFLNELLRVGTLTATPDWGRFKSQLERIPPDLLPSDKRLNPLSMHPYVLFKALPQAKRYSAAELIRALELLLECNQSLIFSGLDDAVVLQQTLVKIVVRSP